jgi:hypothetical protein
MTSSNFCEVLRSDGSNWLNPIIGRRQTTSIKNFFMYDDLEREKQK